MTRLAPSYTSLFVLLLMIATAVPGASYWYEGGPLPIARAKGAGPCQNWTALVKVPVGEEATFTDNGSSDQDKVCDPKLVPDDINSWEWDFGDGTPKVQGKTVKHAFEKFGIYTVKLTVDDGPADPKTHYNEGSVTTDTANSVTVKVWDATITKCAAGWLPTAGEILSFTLQFRPEGIEGYFDVYLEGVSTLQGKCCNAACDDPANDAEPDLQILGPQQGWNTLLKAHATSNTCSAATLAVTCLDYGASGSMSAIAHVLCKDRGAIVVGTDPEETSQGIPVDANSNGIGDAWAHDKKPDESVGGASDDEENAPVGLNTGDGFSRFDEYRGFMISGAHTRTDPDGKKDVYIRDEDSLGLGSFGTLGLESHLISDAEFDSSTHAVNFNGGNNQCAILLRNAGNNTSLAGQCLLLTPPGTNGPGVPCDILRVEIYPEWIRRWTNPTHDGTTVDPDDEAIISQVIAHELAHAVSIHHHSPDTCCSNCNMKYPCPGQGAPIINDFCTTNPGCKSKTKLHP